MEEKIIKIILAGEGGQGIQTAAKVISAAAAEAGFEVSYIPSFGVEQRGSPSVAFITISPKEIHYPRFDNANITMILQQRAIAAVLKYIDAQTTVIFDSSTIQPTLFKNQAKKILGIPAMKLVSEGSLPKASNILMAGVLAQLLGLPDVSTWQVIVKTLGKKFKTEADKEKNRQIFLLGKKFKLEENSFSQPILIPQSGQIKIEGEGKRAIIIPERCKSCGLCIARCPAGALAFGQKLGLFSLPIPEVDLKKCTACDTCSRFCPDGAIKIKKIN